ncbi:hypothetical protein MMC13_004417 [Lambiella insularis]|nr:hypothetical protein [Lambiella insularis]
MVLTKTEPFTTGSTKFSPPTFFTTWSTSPSLPQSNDLLTSITTAFSLPSPDTYTYHAIASVTLSQVQSAIAAGSTTGLHAWYLSPSGEPLAPPPASDIIAYTSIFAPHTSTAKALTSLAANARKGSLRAIIAPYLQSQRLLPPTINIPRSKTHVNPYYDYWAWSCLALEWAGPEPHTAAVKTSHHVLPVFMHHFGCVVPSYEALEVIRQVAGTRAVIDLGSGNGYWTYMLRWQGVEVRAVDNLQSRWRTQWIGDTVLKDGDQYLRGEKGCREAVLLLVYPIVGADFTAKVIGAYQGDTVVIAGTQNENRYTGFRDRTVGEWMQEKGEFEKTVQIALPSFAGKDEALFVFERLKKKGGG